MSAERVAVDKSILKRWVERDTFVEQLVKTLESDQEVTELLHMSNVNAVLRLGYNDHGPVHARIVAGAALELLNILLSKGIGLTSLQQGTAASLDEVKFILVTASYLHDIGNAVHRENHELLGAMLAKDIVDRLISQVLPQSGPRRFRIRQEVLSAIYSTAMDAKPLSVEASIVRLADGLDMSEGRARLPYKLGKYDMHSLSALSIKRVELSPGDDVPVEVTVLMYDLAGFFQVERVLMPKVEGGKLKGLVKIKIVDQRSDKVLVFS